MGSSLIGAKKSFALYSKNPNMARAFGPDPRLIPLLPRCKQCFDFKISAEEGAEEVEVVGLGGHPEEPEQDAA